MEDDIEARLLNVSEIEWLEPLCIEAAHVIKKLRQQIEVRNRTIDLANGEISGLKATNEHLRQKREELIQKLKWAVEEGNKGIVEANRLRKALQEIADIEHENIPPPTAPLEANLWGILNGCITVAEKALGEKE